MKMNLYGPEKLYFDRLRPLSEMLYFGRFRPISYLHFHLSLFVDVFGVRFEIRKII